MSGLPQLCLPVAADQFVNAGAVVKAGVGLALEPESVNVESVREGVFRLLDENAFLERSQMVAEEIAVMPPPEQLVPVIEQLRP